MALRFLSLNINSCVCLRFRCSESGKGTDGGGKTDSNYVLISYAESMSSLPFFLFLFSVSLSVSQASLPPGRTNSVSFSSSYRKLFSLLLFFSFSASFPVSLSPLSLSLSSPLYFYFRVSFHFNRLFFCYL